MSLALPLVRGSVDALVSARSAVDPADLLLRGPAALGEGVSAEDRSAVRSVSAFLVGRRGAIGLEPARGGSGPLRLHRLIDEDAAHLLETGATPLLIGATASGECAIGLVVDERIDEPGVQWAHLRWAGHLLEAQDSALAMSAVALASWHEANRFCSRCGARLGIVLGGWATECPGCGRLEYPRQDPAIIVRIEDADERILLAHNTGWVEPMCSLIAGFVEAGEAPERAVVREVREEVGLEITAPLYRATQPWPFPRSQMLGFEARLAPGCAPEPVPDGSEIAWARFFSREEFVAEVEAGAISAPGPTSIAHALVAEWLGAPMPRSPLALDPLRRP